MREHARRIAIFAVVGLVNTTVDIACFALFNIGLGIRIVPANVLAFLIATINSYVLNRAVTFSDRKGSIRITASGARFLGIALFTLGLSSAIVLVLSPYLHPVLGKILAASSNLLIGYIGSSVLVFPNEGADEQA